MAAWKCGGQRFRNSSARLQGKGAKKGTFITTSSFTKEAIESKEFLEALLRGKNPEFRIQKGD